MVGIAPDEIISLVALMMAIVSPLLALYQLIMIRLELAELRNMASPRPAQPKKVLVPGRGFFSLPREKRKPKVLSDEDAWRKEHEAKRSNS